MIGIKIVGGNAAVVVDGIIARLERAEQLLKLAAARIMLDAIRQNALPIGQYRYADDLCLAISGDEHKPTKMAGIAKIGRMVKAPRWGEMPAPRPEMLRKLAKQASEKSPTPKTVVAILFRPSVGTVRDEDQHVLYVRASRKSPEWVRVLAEHDPWAPSMLPIQVGKQDGHLISRSVSAQELASVESRLSSRAVSIEQQLVLAGRPAKIQRNNGRKHRAHPDVGFAVLRAEFGIGQRRNAAWSEGVALVKRQRNVLQRAMRDYLMGDDKAFAGFGDLKAVHQPEQVLMSSGWFGSKIPGV